MTINESIVSIDSIKESIHHLFELLKEFVEDKIPKISYKKKEKTLEVLIDEVKNSFEELDEEFISLEEYENEYMYFQDISLFFSYMVNNNILTLENIELIYKMVNLFSNLIHLKVNGTEKEYDNYLIDFIINFDDCEDKFYNEIYKPSENYNEKALSEILANLLNMGGE